MKEKVRKLCFTGMILFLLFGTLALKLNASDIEGTEPQQEESEAMIHIGEDGQEYFLGDTDTREWLFGKVDPALASELGSETLDVIVFVANGNPAAAAQKVKKEHKASIDAAANKIRAIDRKYRSTESLDPNMESLAVFAQELAMTNEDWEQMEQARLELDTRLDQMRKEIGKALEEEAAPKQNAVIKFIEGRGGTVNSKTVVVSTVGAVIPTGLLEPLANHPLVVSIVKNRPTEYEINISVPSVDYDTWWSDGLDGGAYDFGIVDSGVQQDHPAFSGVTFYTDSGSTSDTSESGHGTHCTGIAASADATYRGGAYGLDAIIWSLSSGGQSAVIDHMDWQARLATQQPEVINHSLGYGTASDVDYSDTDSFYDALVYNYHLMVSKSCGNNGWHDTLPRITHPAPAYNILVVANMDDQDTTSRADDVRSTSSSVGPTLGGRKKPDITAPGSNIMSTNNSWLGTGSGNPDPDCWGSRASRQGYDWSRCSGTSMSAPHVAAAIVLMEDGGNHEPMAQRAVLINTADAWTSNGTSTTADDGSVNGSLWDKSYGWGYLDMWESHFNRSDYFVDSVIPRNNNATEDDYKLYMGYMYINEKATMVWEKRCCSDNKQHQGYQGLRMGYVVRRCKLGELRPRYGRKLRGSRSADFFA
ncbi:MAG: S8 family serine peptidase [Planctomycetota bacterium]